MRGNEGGGLLDGELSLEFWFGVLYDVFEYTITFGQSWRRKVSNCEYAIICIIFMSNFFCSVLK